jgi:hypothetical protein
LDIVLPTRSGTILQVRGVTVGVGVGRGVVRGVGWGVANGVGVGAGVALFPVGGVVVPPVGASMPPGSGVAEGVALPDAPAGGEPTADAAAEDAASVLTAATGGDDGFALPALSESPLPRLRTSASTTMNPPKASMAAVPPRPIDLVCPATATGAAAATAAVAKYGNAHSGQSPEASAQHHLHEYDWQYGQWQSPT